MPNRINVDTTPPVVKLRNVAPRVLQPGSRLKVRYLLNEPARVRLPGRRRVLLGLSSRLKWKVEWPVRARPGKHRVTVTARDAAGNLSNATRAVVGDRAAPRAHESGDGAPARALLRAASGRRARLLLATRAERRLRGLERAPVSGAEAGRATTGS